MANSSAPQLPLAAIGIHNRDNVSTYTMISIQALRAIAAILVVIFHTYIGFVTIDSKVGSQPGLYYFGFGKVGVHIFFVISGYIMYLTSFNHNKPFNTSSFIKRRIARIYPIYWTFVVLYLVFAVSNQSLPDISFRQFIGMLLLLPNDAPLVIGAAWTLSYEIYFYLIFGISMTLGTNRGVAALTVLFIASVALGVVFRVGQFLPTNGLLLEFLMGVWAARITSNYAFSRAAGWLALIGAVIGYGAGVVWGYDRLPSALAWGVPSVFLVAGAVVLEQRSPDNISKVFRVFAWLGNSSYTLYLCHILFISIAIAVSRATGLKLELWFYLSVITIICVAFAVLFHVLVERPMTSLINRALA